MRRIPCFVMFAVLAIAALPAAAQTLIGSVDVENGPYYLAANPATNMVYVTNTCGNDPACSGTQNGTVSVISGLTNTVVATVTVQIFPEYLVVNPVTNKIYVTNRRSNSVSVINGNTNTVIKTITVGSHPTVADVNPITNKIYVVNNGNGSGTTMSVIDGNTDTVTSTVTVGNYPVSVSVDPVRNTIYVANYCGTYQFGCNVTPAPGTVSVIDGRNNTVTHTVTVGYGPLIVIANNVTNKIYVSNSCGTTASCTLGSGNDANTMGTVTQIDGSSFATHTINTGLGQAAMSMNAVANMVYVTNNTDNTISVINGSSLAVQPVNVGNSPEDVEVNTATNTIVVCNANDNSVSVINGVSLSVIATITVGNTPVEAWVNPVVNRIYVSNVGDNTVSILSGVAPTALQFVPATPCRLIDTRTQHNPIPGGTSRNFNVPSLGGCGIPSSAKAFSLNVTAIPAHTLGYLTIWPTGEAQPVASTMNSPDGRVKANAAIVPAGNQASVSVFATDTTDVILDINGYFKTPGSGTNQFYKLTPCRIVDTRGNHDGGTLQAGVERDYNIANVCGIPSTATAYSLNVAVDPNHKHLDYLTVWPKGQTMPGVSTLNDPKGTIVANAAIVPAGMLGATAFFASGNNTDLLVDVDGYFAPPGSGGLQLYTQVPCRVLDTRGVDGGHGFNGIYNSPNGVNVVDSSCLVPTAAKAYVFNATVVPPGPMLYLTLWPHNETQPNVSTLNALDGAITSNMAIVPTDDGSIDAFSAALTQLLLDISGYYAP